MARMRHVKYLHVRLLEEITSRMRYVKYLHVIDQEKTEEASNLQSHKEV